MKYVQNNVALENNVNLSSKQFLIAHDRATFMAPNKIQKLMESGGHQKPQTL